MKECFNFIKNDNIKENIKKIFQILIEKDNNLIIRHKKEICGVSYPDKRYLCYISQKKECYYFKFYNLAFDVNNDFNFDNIINYIINFDMELYQINDKVEIDNKTTIDSVNNEETHIKSFKELEQVLIDFNKYLDNKNDNINSFFIPDKRCKNALVNANIKDLLALSNLKYEELINLPNFGRRSAKVLTEIIKLIILDDKLNKHEEINKSNIDKTIYNNKIKEDLYSYITNNYKEFSNEYCENNYNELVLKMKERFLSLNLEQKKYEIICKYLFNNMTLESIGNDYGLSRERIRQLLKKFLRKIHSKQIIKEEIVELKDSLLYTLLYIYKHNKHLYKNVIEEIAYLFDFDLNEYLKKNK